jgi:2-keto-3-deoxy-6-phosphogluconate aldolase
MTAGTASSSRSFDVLLGDRRVVAVVRHSDPQVAHALCVTALDGGLGVVEVTCSVPEAAALIERLCGSGAGDVLIGAGTVLSAGQAREVLAAGAQFVVSPGISAPVIDVCRESGVPVVAGVLTPSEVLVALGHDLDTVTADNAHEWIAAGARAVGIGSDFNSAWEVGGRAAVHRLATRLRMSLEPDAPTLRPSHRSTLDRTHSAEIRAYPARLTAARPCERRTVRLDQER